MMTSGFARLLQDEQRDAGVVVHRLGVRHAGDGGEAARDSRGRAGGDRLLMFLTGLAQVHVNIDEARCDDE